MKKIISFIVLLLLFATNILQTDAYINKSYNSNDIRSKLIKIKNKQKQKERDYKIILSKADTIIENYKIEINKKGKKYIQSNKKKIEEDLNKGQQTKLEIIKAANEKLKENLINDIKTDLGENYSLENLKIEPNYIFELAGASYLNDPGFQNQWGIKNILGNQEITNLNYSGNKTTVAVIDAGVDFSNTDLKNIKWSSNECYDENNNIIQNGCNDGGYDFIDNDTNPYPNEKLNHGTNVASIIGAENNNGYGITSIANTNINLMSLRVCGGANAYIDSENISKAIYFATNNGAKIINASFGGPTFSKSIEDAIIYAKTKGVIVITAAGNYSSNNDISPLYPANYNLDNIVSVASIGNGENISSFSNYGKNTVDIAAPGESISAINVDGTIGNVNGTSFSTPYVTSVFARYLAQNNTLNYIDLKNKVFVNSKTNLSLTEKVTNGLQLQLDTKSVENILTQNTQNPIDQPPVQIPTLVVNNSTINSNTSPELKKDYSNLMLKTALLRQGKISYEKTKDNISIQESKTLEEEFGKFVENERNYLNTRNDISQEKKDNYLALLNNQLNVITGFNTELSKSLSEGLSPQTLQDNDAFKNITQNILNKLGVVNTQSDAKISPEMSAFKYANENKKIDTIQKASIIDQNNSYTPQSNLGKTFIQGVIPPSVTPLSLKDIQQDSYVVINEQITNLAKQLEYNPVKIFNYVKNNIHYEAYYGSKKSSINCLNDGYCNDVDQSNLTIALLRASGIPARYKQNYIIVNKNNINKLLGVNDLKLAFLALVNAKVPVYRVNTEGTISQDTILSNIDFTNDKYIAIEWTNVETLISYDHTGGNYSNTLFLDGVSTIEQLNEKISQNDNLEWVTIDPSFKFSTVNNENNKDLITDAHLNVDTFYGDYLKNSQNVNVLAKLKNDFINNNTLFNGLSDTQKEIEFNKYLFTKKIKQTNLETLPLGLPYIVAEGITFNGTTLSQTTMSELSDSLKQKFEIEVKRVSNNETILQNVYTVNELNNSPITLDYVGATESDIATIQNYGSINLTPSGLADLAFSLDTQSIPEQELVQGKTVTIGENLIIHFNYYVGGNKIDSSAKYSIGGNSEGMYFAFGKIKKDTLDDNSKVLLAGNWAIAKKYLERLEDASANLGSMLNIQNDLHYSRAVVTQNRVLNTVNGNATTFDFKGLTLDAHAYLKDYVRSNYIQNQTRSVEFQKLFGLYASEQEGQIFDDITGLTGISTVKGLQYAFEHPSDYQVLYIGQSNKDIIDTLSFSDNTKASMKQYISEGKNIITPDKQVTDQNWNGIFYLALAPDGSGHYAIGEQVVGNGGWTVDEFNVEEDHEVYSKLLTCDDTLSTQLNSNSTLCKATYIEKTNDSFCSNFNYISLNNISEIEQAEGYNKAIHGAIVGKFKYAYHDVILTQKYAKFVSNNKPASGLNYSYWVSSRNIKAKLESYLNNSNHKKDGSEFYKYSDVGTFMVWQPNKKIASYYSPVVNQYGELGDVFSLQGEFLGKADSKYGGNSNLKTIGVIGMPISEEKLSSVKIGDIYYSYKQQDFLHGYMFRYENFYNIFPNTHYTAGDLAMYRRNHKEIGLPKQSPNYDNATYITQSFDNDKYIEFNRSTKEVKAFDDGRYYCTNSYYGSLKDGTDDFSLTLIGLDGMLENVGDLLTFPIDLGISIGKGILKTKDEIKNGTYFGSQLETIINIYGYLTNLSKDEAIAIIYKFGGDQKVKLLNELLSEQTNCDARVSYNAGRLSGLVLNVIIEIATGKSLLNGQKADIKTVEKFLDELEKIPDTDIKVTDKITLLAKSPCFLSMTLQGTSVQAVSKCVNILNISTKVKGKIEHIMKAKPERGGYTGLHSLNEMDSRTYDIEIDKIKFPDTKNKPYIAKVLVEIDGKILQKTNNINDPSGLGESSFFPDNWTRAKIMEEVEFAVKNNQGKLEPNKDNNLYFGYSKNNIKIGFYLTSNGTIPSYFPILD